MPRFLPGKNAGRNNQDHENNQPQRKAQAMNNTKHAVAVALFASTQNGKKHYTKASAQKLMILLAKFHGIQIQRRWLFKCLADMEATGLIKRKKRYDHKDHGTIRQYSSMITFTLEGLRYLTAKKVEGATVLFKKMIDWLKKKDYRFPRVADIATGITPEQAAENINRIKGLIQGLT